MDVQGALKEQYHAGLAMLAECVEKCPDDVWISGNEPRTFWRIAFHGAFFTQLYLGQDETVVEPWPGVHPGHDLFSPVKIEPYDLPSDSVPYSRQELLNYIGFVDGLVDSLVDQLDLERLDPGISWYKNMTKLSHVMMNLRHLQGHVGQLSELLMLHGIDTNWIGKVRAKTP